MDLLIKVFAFMLFAAGTIIVFASRKIVVKYGLEKKAKCGYEDQMSEEEVMQYKLKRAELNVKMLGMLVLLPGIVILLVVFR